MSRPPEQQNTISSRWWVRLCQWLWSQRRFIWSTLIVGILIGVAATWLTSSTSIFTGTLLGTILLWIREHLLLAGLIGVILLLLTLLVGAVSHLAPASVMSVQPSQVRPVEHSDAPQLVYALGTIGYDLGTNARRDALIQAMPGGRNDPGDAGQLLAYLVANPYNATWVIWTLNVDATPIYAIRPAGPYAGVAYERLREFLTDQVTGEVEMVAVPGILAGSATLLSGQTVPQIVPELDGMTSWRYPALVEAVLGVRPEAADLAAAYDQRRAGLRNSLQRISYKLRNLGLSSQERAMNFVATNLYQAMQAFTQAAAWVTELDSITAERSPICRPTSDCWDVKLTFFNPARRLEQARREFHLTVDVSDVMPVTVGEVRSW